MSHASFSFALAVALAWAGAARADTYKIDPVHSFVHFQAGHIGIGYVGGRFNELAGTFELDDAGKLSTFQAEVKTASVDTNKKERDAHLKTADFFDAAKYPAVTFKATTVKTDDAGNFILGGELSLHGVTKTIATKLTKRGEGKDPWGGFRVGLHGQLVVKRSDYAMNYQLLPIDDEVLLSFSFEGVKQAD